MLFVFVFVVVVVVVVVVAILIGARSPVPLSKLTRQPPLALLVLSPPSLSLSLSPSPFISLLHTPNRYALARPAVSSSLAAYKLASWAIKQLQQQAVPSLWQDQIDRTVVSIQSKPFSDKEELRVNCSRCLHTNPLINNIGTGDSCVNCGAPFLRCMGTFEVLPFVEFTPAESITRKQTFKLLSQLPGGEESGSGADTARASSSYRDPTPKRGAALDGGDILGGSDDDDEFGGYGRSSSSSSSRYGSYGRANNGSNSSSSSTSRNSSSRGGNAGGRSKEEAFNRQLMRFEPGKPYKMVSVDSKMLLAMNGEQCVIVEAPTGNTRYLRNMMPEEGPQGVTVCTNCGCFFRSMSFEFAYLRDGGCPFCKSSNTGTDLDDVETRSIAANRKAAEARDGAVGRSPDRWEVHRIVVG